MSLNVMQAYMDFKKNIICDYASLVLEKYYKKQTFSKLANTYVKIRYEDLDSELVKTHEPKKVISILNTHLISKAKKLLKKDKDFALEQMLYFFGFVYQLDNIVSVDDEILLSKINEYRKNTLNFVALSKNSFLGIKKDHDKRLANFYKQFEDNYFALDVKKTSSKVVRDVKLTHSVPMSKLYSDYAIDNVFNNGVVGENKLFIEYYMTALRVLRDAEYYEFNRQYMVEFNPEIIVKEEKIRRLLNIIDNDLMKDKISLKITYTDYLNNKDKITKIIKKGYSFTLVIDDKYEYLDNELLLCNLFRYVIIPKDVSKNKTSTINNGVIIK